MRAVGLATLGSLMVACCALALILPPVLPDAEYPKLIAPTVEVIVTALAGQPTRRAVERARVAALMLAEYAQQNLGGPDGQQRATLRDAALVVAGSIKDKNYPEAAKQAQLLAGLPANPAARRTQVKLLGPHLDLDEVMSQFRSIRMGGLGIEDRLDALAVSKGAQVPADELTDSLRMLAFRTAVVAELTRQHVADKQPKQWQADAEAMRTAAVELGAAAGAKDGKRAFAAVESLIATCNKCHKDYRK